MSLEKEIQTPNGSKCGFCGATNDLKVDEVLPTSSGKAYWCIV